jgi:hypothetical protein
MFPSRSIHVFAIGLASCIACAGRKESLVPDVAVLGESTRWRVGDSLPANTPWFSGASLDLAGARGETLGLQVFHRASVAVSLAIEGVDVRAFSVDTLGVRRPSTAMYGGSQGKGDYPDALTPATAPASNPAYFEIAIPRDASPGRLTGELAVGDKRFPVTLAIASATLPPPRLDVWAYFDQRELGWAAGDGDQPPKMTPRSPTDAERSCVDMFRAHGVLLSPDLTPDLFASRKDLLFGFPHVPAVISDDPAKVGDQIRAWIDVTKGTGQVPFAIPIDEPKPADRARVRALAEAVRAAGGGPSTFRFAVTDEPRPEYGDVIDLYISWNAAHLTGDKHDRWTYNGKPPRAGSMVLDTRTPGMRTWGWIAHRYNIPVWYVWDALYWHDRHNLKRRKLALPGPAFSRTDAITFDDGDDRGNLDGVLALPTAAGTCQPTLRLAALRRGLQDRALLELAARCDPAATAKLAAEIVPRALGDAPDTGTPAWPADEATWETARRKLLALASCGK